MIEGASTGVMETLTRIALLDGVVAANMVFEHVEFEESPEMKNELTRRDVLKAHAAGIAAATAGIALPASAQPVPGASAPLRSNGRRRHAGSADGCGVMVGVKEGQVVATHGDMQAEVNRGLNCVKGYFLSKIMYGADRLTTPLLRKRDGAYDKEGEFEPVSWDEAFDVMAAKCKKVLKEKGPTASACSAPGNGRSSKVMPRPS